MIRQRLNRILNTRIFLIVFSILASVILWIYVTHVENEDVSVTLNGVKVEFTGAESLTENNLVITNVDQRSLLLRITGKRGAVTRLTKDNVTATLDLTQILSSPYAGIYQLEYTLNYPANVDVNSFSEVRRSPNFITVTIEKIVSRPIPVRGTYSGDIAEGYRAEPLELGTDTITVYGPEAEVSRVDHAEVALEQASISMTIEQQVPVTLVDKEGNEIRSENLTLSQDTVLIRLPVIMVKDVPLTVSFVYSASATEANVIYDINPKYVTLSGDTEELAALNQIQLANIDLTDFSQTYSDTFPIIIPNAFSNLTGDTAATVTVSVTGMETQRLSVTNIDVRNTTDGYVSTIITQSLDVTLRGPAASISAITAENIRIIADLVDVGNITGTVSVPARVRIDGFTDVDAIGTYKVTVSLAESNGVQEEPEPGTE